MGVTLSQWGATKEFEQSRNPSSPLVPLFPQYLIQCSKIPTLRPVSFLLGWGRGVWFNLMAQDYIIQIAWGGIRLCLSGFRALDMPLPTGSFWTFGDIFLGR